uniref:Transmembrane protein n=2 Tax=Burkholderiaceae TaxID=119060 RepID=Q46W22_CUPPJ
MSCVVEIGAHDYANTGAVDNRYGNSMQPIYAYALHLLASLVLLAVFVGVYTRITPFHEFTLIRQGNIAAALSLGGALLGFCFTLSSSIQHNDTFPTFLSWAVGAMIVQALVYAGLTRALPDMDAAIESNNIGMGALMGTISVTVGAINAACLS